MILLTRLCLWAQARNRSTQIWRSLVWLALNLNTWSTKSIIETTQIFKKETLTRQAWSLAYNRMSDWVSDSPPHSQSWLKKSVHPLHLAPPPPLPIADCSCIDHSWGKLLTMIHKSNWPILQQMVLEPPSFRLQNKPSVLPSLHHVGELWELQKMSYS